MRPGLCIDGGDRAPSRSIRLLSALFPLQFLRNLLQWGNNACHTLIRCFEFKFLAWLRNRKIWHVVWAGNRFKDFNALSLYLFNRTMCVPQMWSCCPWTAQRPAAGWITSSGHMRSSGKRTTVPSASVWTGIHTARPWPANRAVKTLSRSPENAAPSVKVERTVFEISGLFPLCLFCLTYELNDLNFYWKLLNLFRNILKNNGTKPNIAFPTFFKDSSR